MSNEMNNYVAKHRLENKLRLWETPGFFQFINELCDWAPLQEGKVDLREAVNHLELQYKAQLKDMEERDNKFKQGELEL